MQKYLSVQWKILTPMALIFVAIMTIVTLYSAEQQKDRLLNMTEHQMRDILNGYLDSMNTLMFTGTMANRGLLLEKIAQREGVVDVRMLRGEAVDKVFGPGFESETALDEYDRRALQGEPIVISENNDGERLLTVMEPFVAVSNRNGTNCLGCHQVTEGTVLGAARITYSLAQRDANIHRALLTNAGINFGVLILGLIVLHFIMFKVVIKPLNNLKNTMLLIGRDADLRPRVELGANDEFRQVGEATNKMLDRFQPTIHDLTQTMDGLANSADKLALVTRTTRDGVGEQQQASEQLADYIKELSAAAIEVAQNASDAEQAASTAKLNTDAGSSLVVSMAEGITRLATQVENAALVVKQLAEDTQGIGQVSESINDIAEQTNLLALNAAIEAARAGEQGRGFAVVADEVRNLANRTQQSTSQIRDIVEQLVATSSKAVQVMDESTHEADHSTEESNKARQALEDIADTMEAIQKRNAMIAAAASDQSHVVDEIERHIQAIRAVSQQNADGSNQTLKESEEIAQVAAKLDSMVNRFKV